jgi:predicted RNA polymerase sigma factor
VVSRAEGPTAGLAVLDPLADAPELARYHLLPAVRADLLEQLGRVEEADRELARALELARTGAERQLLARRREALHAR